MKHVPRRRLHGLARCALHPSILDRGAFFVSFFGHVYVAEEAYGGESFEAWLLRSHDQPLQAPVSGQHRIAEGVMIFTADHAAESIEFWTTFPDHELNRRPYRVFFVAGAWTCSIARFRGTMTGPMKGPDGTEIPPTGKSFDVEFCTVARWEDGQIVEENLMYDLVTFMKQIGLDGYRPWAGAGSPRQPPAQRGRQPAQTPWQFVTGGSSKRTGG